MTDLPPDAYIDRCPGCGHRFALAELKHMAMGDGWQRYILIELDNGARKLVTFDEFDPVRMRPAAEPAVPRAP